MSEVDIILIVLTCMAALSFGTIFVIIVRRIVKEWNLPADDNGRVRSKV